MKFFLLLCLALCLVGCGDDDVSDAGDADAADVMDAGDTQPDVVLPPGPRGDILRVPENKRGIIPSLDEDAYVVRTEVGIPHIYAANQRDLRRVQGYVMAEDRYFQIEAGRRLAKGTLSELIGDSVLASDIQSRGQGMTIIADRIMSQLTPEQEQMLDDYALGINAYIQAVADGNAPLPTVFSVAAPLLQKRPIDLMTPLDRSDLVAFAVVAVFQLGFETGDPLFTEALTQVDAAFGGLPKTQLRRDGAKEDLLLPVTPVNAVSSAPTFGLNDGSALVRKTRPQSRRPVRVEQSMLRRLRTRLDVFEDRMHGGRHSDFGSNAWATMGRVSEGGAAILSGDGHLPLSVAPLFYQMGLDSSLFNDAATNDEIEQYGLFFAGIPNMAVGTNGHVAWSQTYLRGDVTDWYGEQLTLDENGAPASSLYLGEQRALQAVDEVYELAAVPALNSVGGSKTFTRYATYDGRLLAAVEGEDATVDTIPGAGETLINVMGAYVVPKDVNDDGIISGVSFDFTGFDVSNILLALEGFGKAKNVDDFRAASRRLVVYSQNLVAADVEGNVYYGSYNATPCRGYLREANGEWKAGGNPRGLIDGTQFGGFEVVLDSDGLPDETQSDPQKCLVPFDEWPSNKNPASGYVLNANNDIGNLSTDGSLDNDQHYIGGPWTPGYRAKTIDDELARLASNNGASVPTMQALQGDHTSPLAEQFASILVDTISEASQLPDVGLTPAQTRLKTLYESHRDRLMEAASRLSDWRSDSYVAHSGVDTFYNESTEQTRASAVATMIFNQWWRELIAQIFDDEQVDFVFALDRRRIVPQVITHLFAERDVATPTLRSYDTDTGESVYFDRTDTDVVEESEEIVLLALVSALDRLTAAETAPGIGGFGTPDMSKWLWGHRHQVKFDSILASFGGTDNAALALLANGFSITPDNLPLAEDLDETDLRASSPHFPRPGDLYNVDAANTSFSPTADYFYGSGPVMRMVIRLERDNISGENILPGGQSGITDSDHFSDQAALWLGNKAVPLRYHVESVIEGAVSRQTFSKN